MCSGLCKVNGSNSIAAIIDSIEIRQIGKDTTDKAVSTFDAKPLLKFGRLRSIKRSACCHKQYSDKRTYSFHTSTPSSVKSYGTTDQYTEPSTKNGGQITSFCNIDMFS